MPKASNYPQQWCEEGWRRSISGRTRGRGEATRQVWAGRPLIHRGGLHGCTHKCDWERSNGCLGGTHGSWSPPPPLSPFIEAQTGLITRLTKGGVGLGHRGQYDVPHKDGGTEQGPYGSADALVPRVRDDVGRG